MIARRSRVGSPRRAIHSCTSPILSRSAAAVRASALDCVSSSAALLMRMAKVERPANMKSIARKTSGSATGCTSP